MPKTYLGTILKNDEATFTVKIYRDPAGINCHRLIHTREIALKLTSLTMH